MPPRRAKKTVNSAVTISNPTPTHPTILGEETPPKDADELAPSSPPANPTMQRETTPSEDEDDEYEGNGKGPRMTWTDEMWEQLVEVLHQVFEDGGAADNSFKKATFEKAAVRVRRVYKGPHEITHTKCKNKWADTKKNVHIGCFYQSKAGLVSTKIQNYMSSTTMFGILLINLIQRSMA